MILYTYQLAHWRRLQDRGVQLIDTTVKTGYTQVAPTWEMVMGHKQGSVSDASYTEQYSRILEYWWFRDPLFFENLLELPAVAFGCYCKAGVFCHRHLLVTFIQRVNSAEYRGELS